MKKISLGIALLLFLGGCSGITTSGRECPPDAMIEWVDALKINGVSYYAMEPGSYTFEDDDKGDAVGEVAYEMSGNACTDHQMRNGDAAFLSPGTEIYKHTGYKETFRVIAGDQIYQVNDNENAQTIGDLYDIEGKVSKVSFASREDGSHVEDLNEENSREFIDEFLEFEYVGFDEVYKEIENEEGLFLRIQDRKSVV